MQFLSGVLGVLILLVLLLEVLWTTMGLGGGLLTRLTSHWLHRVALALHRRTGKRLVLAWAGIWIVMIIFASWIVLLWLGWTLVFLAGNTAVVNTQTGQPADFWERAYFVGFSIFTLGLGDFRPQGHLWQILTAVATVHGLFSVTFAITYLVPIVQAATQMRQIAVIISSLGLSAEEILLTTWNGGDCTELGEYLVDMVPALAQLQQRHITYPVLNYFHSMVASASLSPGMAALDEALTILEHGFEGACGLSSGCYRPVRRIVSEFLQTLHVAYIEPTETDPPPPSLAVLRRSGLPVVDEDRFEQQIEHLSLRRRLLQGFVENDGWRWNQFQSPNEERLQKR